MNATYALRDARVTQIDAILPPGGLPPDASTGEVALHDQRKELGRNRWQVNDRTYRLVAEEWLWDFSDADALFAAVNQDPIVAVSPAAALLTQAQAASIPIRPPDLLLPRPGNYLDLVRAAVGNDQPTFDQLLQAAHWQWLTSDPSNRPHPYDDVCILLPVRLETLFEAPDPHSEDQRWVLRIRVVPDEASIVRDSSYLTYDERTWIEDFWKRARSPGLSPSECAASPNADLPWKLLADRVGPRRAAYLVALPVDLSGELPILELPADYPALATPNVVGGLPDELWIKAEVAIPGQPPSVETIGRLPEHGDRIIDPAELIMPMPRNADDLDTHWLTSFAQAREVGLGGMYVLSPGINPETISTLYVVGSGDREPEQHFRSLIDSGDFQMIRIGTPTNVVKDSGLPLTPEPDWRRVAVERLVPLSQPVPAIPGDAARAIARGLAGVDAALPSFPGADLADDCGLSIDLVRALWPALWGHWLRDIWQMDNNAYYLGRWMQERFAPLGPLMPIRIGEQPYGLVPSIDLANWTPEQSSNADENTTFALLEKAAGVLVEARDAIAAVSHKPGNVVGKSTQEFTELLGRPALSHAYAIRWFAPPLTWMSPSNPSQAQVEEARARAADAYAIVRDRLGALPTPEPYVTSGYWWPNDLPLVQPNRAMMKYQSERIIEFCPLESFLRAVHGSGVVDLDIVFLESSWVIDGADYRLSTLPDSLLARLLVYSWQIAESWRMAPFGTGVEAEVLDVQHSASRAVAKAFDRSDWTKPVQDPVTGRTYFAPQMDESIRNDVERALGATLDSAAHRIDPWSTAYAWDRLIRNSTSDRGLHRMGIYGWVDGPFRGTPGPNEAGLLHTPSQAQTSAALILRDNFLSRSSPSMRAESNTNPWQLDVNSRKARLAREIADEVRFGFHIYVVVGRMVEEIVGDHQLVREMRASAYGMRPERQSPDEVCNGFVALAGLLAGNPSFPMSPDQQKQLHAIRDALDTYADLLIADGVMQILDRQMDRAAETMDAAAGFSRPPTFEFLQTPPSGYQLDTSVVSVLPFVPVDDPRNGSHPVKLADPSMAVFIEQRFATPWQWTGHERPGGPAIDTVTLDDLGLTVCDAITLGADFLELLARSALDPRTNVIEPPVEHRQVQHLVAAMGSRPALGSDLVSTTDRVPISTRQLAIDTAIYEDLLGRYEALIDACTTFADDLETAADDATRTALLRMALPWGAIPASRPEDRNALVAALLGRPAAEPASSLADICKSAVETLRSRLPKELPPGAENMGALLPDEVERKRKGIPDGIPSLTRAIAELASPGAKLAITATWTTAIFLQESRVIEDTPDLTLDETWLTVVAAPRAPLARLEAAQLELDDPLHGWTNAPGNPWRNGDDPDDETNVVARNRLRRRDTSIANMDTTRFVAAYGIDEVWQNERLAIGLIDAFGEAIPMTQRSTAAAFGFNAPAARPPQTISLGVPATPRTFLDSEEVFRIVRETRKNALARAVRIEEMGEMQAVLPTSWLQATGETRMRLEPWPLYETV